MAFSNSPSKKPDFLETLMTDMTEVNQLSAIEQHSGAPITNDPRDASGARLQQAMQRLGRHPVLRKAMMDLLQRAETQLSYSGPVRDDVTRLRTSVLK